MEYFLHRTEEEKAKIREAGTAAKAKLLEALKELKKAKRWGTIDFLGGRLLATAVKQKHMTIARQYIFEAKKEMEKGGKVYDSIIYLLSSTGLDTNNFLGEADYLGRDYRADAEILERINGVKDTVDRATEKIGELLEEL